jgi:small subunit ribosomal protein S3
MGQKTHPQGFRLVTTQQHLSTWYAKKSSYSKLIQEDYIIREKIEKTLGDFLSLSKIKIERSYEEDVKNEYVNIIVHALYPRAKEMSRKLGKQFLETTENTTKTLFLLNSSKNNIKQVTSFILKKSIRSLVRFFQLKTQKDYYITIKFIKNPFEDALLIAKYIGEQLEKRIPFRRAIKQTIKKVQKTEIKGIKIQVSGRLNGVEIARSEWKREGCIPLHTLRAKIDYTDYRAETIYGVIGIKVWLFRGE